MAINCDSDMPASLNTEKKQKSKARELAQAHLGTKATKTAFPKIQGFFSSTVFVTMLGGKKVVIQFRVEPLDVGYLKKAQKALGEVVPDLEQLLDADLESEGVWAFFMTFIPGKACLVAETSKNNVNLTAACSLGHILSRGIVEEDSAHVVDNVIKPCLRKIQGWKSEALKPFLADIERLLHDANHLKSLPLFISHFDLNKMNILVKESGEVSGIVDWELAWDLPFGMGLHQIHDTAGEFCLGDFEMPEDFEEVERGFWAAAFDGVSADVRKVLESSLDAIQTSIHLGTLFWTLDCENKDDEEISPDNVSYKYLKKVLTYRLPAQRGPDRPYQI